MSEPMPEGGGAPPAGGLMQRQVMGIPMPIIIVVAVAGGAYLLFFRKKSGGAGTSSSGNTATTTVGDQNTFPPVGLQNLTVNFPSTTGGAINVPNPPGPPPPPPRPGPPNPQPKPPVKPRRKIIEYKVPATGKTTLAEIAAKYHLTPQQILTASEGKGNPHGPAFWAYVRKGDWKAALPHGTNLDIPVKQ